MKRLFVASLITGFLLPTHGWSQRPPAPLGRPGTAKPESKQARYARLDQYAQQLPEAQAATVDKLAASLATQARSDDDKARLIFAWLAYHIAYDATRPSSSDTTERWHRCSPAYVLQYRKTVCQGYADLFTALARRMRLQASTVAGHGRTREDTGDLLSVANGHAWNAYQVAGKWHLADATWGAGGTLIGTDEFKQQFESCWFDTPPDQMIFSHLPDSASWQLLAPPVTAATYQQWPCIAPAWFELISAERLRRMLAANPRQLDSLPVAQPNIHRVQLIQAPKSGKLVAGCPVKFVFSVPVGVEMFIETDTSSVPLQAAGNYWQATITPTSGKVWVAVQRKDDFATSVNLLRYEIIPAPSAKRRPSSIRSIASTEAEYLRP